MQEIPPAKSSDAEDVVWGLQTADTLWRRGERIDAIVWLRRAAQAAGAANDDDRAVELARCAAELSDWMATLPPGKMSEAPPPGSAPAPNQDAITTFVPGMEQPSPVAHPATGPTGTERPPPPHAPPASSPTLETAMPSFDGRDDAPSVLPAEHVHAGMFNPWADNPERPSLPQPAPPPKKVAPPVVAPAPAKVAPAPAPPEDDEVITSVKPAPIASAKAPPMPPPPKLPAKPPPLPPRARPQGSHQPPPAPQPPPPPASEPSVSVDVEIETEALDAPAERPSAEELVPVPAFPRMGSMPAAEEPTSTAPAATRPALDLDAVEAFADLPDDARAAFAAAAEVHDLAEGEEVSHFALAYVLTGEMDVAATMVDAPALRLREGNVLRSRGTTNEGVPMRLICATGDGRVATWSTRDVEEAFRVIPWVEDDLRAASDRAMTLVGITIGPLGERLDVSIREEIVGKLTMKPLEPHELVVNVGDAVPGLFLVGVGELELVRDDVVVGKVGSGDFLFATEVLGAGPAPATARAGAGGALILFGDLRVAQELLVTCPPLLEVFAGM